jgi:fused signal recognition particle receptor
LNLLDRFRAGLRKTRERLGENLTEGLGGLLGRRSVDAATREELEEALLSADVGPAATDRLIDEAIALMQKERELDLRAALERTAGRMLGGTTMRFEPGTEKPWVALLVGVNGVGKTTLAGKLAARFAREGRSTLLVAADTFRAAASEQLEVWAERAGVRIVRGGDGADPAAVVHDGLDAARARGHDVVLVDTAGRLHTRHNLMAELEKVARVCARQVPGAPHHVLLVLDATLGQNGLQQAREFQKAVPVTSLALTKLDGTAKGGAVLAIVDQLRLPVSIVGLGEGLDDWEPFDPEAFAKGLFE